MAIHGNQISEINPLRSNDFSVTTQPTTIDLQHASIASEPGELTPLAEEILRGLKQSPKRLSSQFFYDAEGSRLFQQIMHLPEYYLTRSEYEILENHKADFLTVVAPDSHPFELIELGAGDGLKTKILLRHFQEQQASFSYVPIDISSDALDELANSLREQFPDLPIQPQHNDYFQALELLSASSNARKVVLFLGSNIGNFSPAEAIGFYHQLSDRLRPGDLVLTGFDLKKHPAVILAAYNDRQGVTRAFNLNMLHRINVELSADFNVTDFDHYPTYNPENGEARSYLVSQKNQIVHIDALAVDIAFEYGEIIHTEISRKFTHRQIHELAEATGFTVKNWFTDCKGYFVDAVFEKQ